MLGLLENVGNNKLLRKRNPEKLKIVDVINNLENMINC